MHCADINLCHSDLFPSQTELKIILLCVACLFWHGDFKPKLDFAIVGNDTAFDLSLRKLCTIID